MKNNDMLKHTNHTLTAECNRSRSSSWAVRVSYVPVCGVCLGTEVWLCCCGSWQPGLHPGLGLWASVSRLGSLISQTCVLLAVALPAYAHSRIPSVYLQLIMRGSWACQAFSKLEREWVWDRESFENERRKEGLEVITKSVMSQNSLPDGWICL